MTTAFILFIQFDLYASDENGNIIHILKKIPTKGNKINRGYLMVHVRKHSQSGFKHYLVHRFVWEYFNGAIPEGKVIDHINNDKEDNRLCNTPIPEKTGSYTETRLNSPRERNGKASLSSNIPGVSVNEELTDRKIDTKPIGILA